MGLILWLACAMAFQSGPAFPQDRPGEHPQVVATGIGRPPADASSPIQAKAMAERAAFLEAVRKAAQKAGRQAPANYSGTIRVGAIIQGFRITRVTPLPDGSVEIEVSVSRAGITP